MSVTSGTRFGTYEIVEAIGKGGMGEVDAIGLTTFVSDVHVVTQNVPLPSRERDRVRVLPSPIP